MAPRMISIQRSTESLIARYGITGNRKLLTSTSPDIYSPWIAIGEI
jgi:hypothetical protein